MANEEQILNGFTEMMRGFWNNQNLEVSNPETPYKQELCEDDTISRRAALDAMCALCNTGETLKENPWRDNPHIDAITDALNNLQPVTPQPKEGYWIDADGDNAICGCCNRLNHLYGTYCKHCGAKMVELQESEE